MANILDMFETPPFNPNGPVTDTISATVQVPEPPINSGFIPSTTSVASTAAPEVLVNKSSFPYAKTAIYGAIGYGVASLIGFKKYALLAGIASAAFAVGYRIKK